MKNRGMNVIKYCESDLRASLKTTTVLSDSERYNKSEIAVYMKYR